MLINEKSTGQEKSETTKSINYTTWPYNVTYRVNSKNLTQLKPKNMLRFAKNAVTKHLMAQTEFMSECLNNIAIYLT